MGLILRSWPDRLRQIAVVGARDLRRAVGAGGGRLLPLTLVMNPGLAFGMLGGMPEALRWMVGLLSIGAIVVLAVLAARLLPTGGIWTRLALGLIFGGAAGNLIDRVRFGAVVDFLDFYWRDYHWPAFNVADSAITVG
jgi:signal peptidase II